LVAYGGGNYESEKWRLGVSVYSENDSKNQSLQQNLSDAQVQILSDAGDDTSQMVAPSEVMEPYNENRILYKKELINGAEAFVFSNNPDDELYRVTFSQVGANQGNYVLSSINAINNIFEYVEPIAGIPQGNYAPIVQLVAPTKLQIAVLNGSYTPSEKTTIDFEVAGSKNDLNLFSTLDDANNDGFAGKLKINQTIIKKDSLWRLDAYADGDFIHNNFKTIQRLYNAEFNRDWNLDTPLGNQQLLKTGLLLNHPEKGMVNYQFEHLEFSENFNGNRHITSVNFFLNNLNIISHSSFLKAQSNINSSTFLRSFNKITYQNKNHWMG